MSARKLGRLAGLVFVLAAILGGTGSAALGAQHVAGGPQAAQVTIQVIDWV
jgi:hypothetical protein